MWRSLITSVVVAGLWGCGPAASDIPSRGESPIEVSGGPERQTNAEDGTTAGPARSSTEGAGSVTQAIPRQDQDDQAQARFDALQGQVNEEYPEGMLGLLSALNNPDERVRTKAEALAHQFSAINDAEDQPSR